MRGGVRVGGTRIECIRFAYDMVLLAGRILNGKDKRDLNRTCEQFGIKIGLKRTKSTAISKMSRTAHN